MLSNCFKGCTAILISIRSCKSMRPRKLRHSSAKEFGTETTPRYVAVMPWPVKDLDEWKQQHMEVAPDADPAQAA